MDTLRPRGEALDTVKGSTSSADTLRRPGEALDTVKKKPSLNGHPSAPRRSRFTSSRKTRR